MDKIKKEYKELEQKIKEAVKVLDNHWQELINREGVLNIQISTKIVNKKDTGEPSITIYVTKKLPKKKLLTSQIIPKEIDGIKTDVVELSTLDYELGPTSVSKLNPTHQFRLASGLKCKGKEN